jgi:phosphoribosylcarboxyaminoimidazole (NCAIR) mutase
MKKDSKPLVGILIGSNSDWPTLKLQARLTRFNTRLAAESRAKN